MSIKYICKVCGQEINVNSTNWCSDRCRFIYDIGVTMKNRIHQPVDFHYLNYLYSQDRCYYCNRELEDIKRNSMQHQLSKRVDHKIPVCRGGGNNNENLCMACNGCNSRKKDMTEDEYIEFQKYHWLAGPDSNLSFALEMLTKYHTLKIEHREILRTVTKKRFRASKYTLKKDGNLFINDKGEEVIKPGTYLYSEQDVTYVKTWNEITDYGRIYNTIHRINGMSSLINKNVKVIKEYSDIRKVYAE